VSELNELTPTVAEPVQYSRPDPRRPRVPIPRRRPQELAERTGGRRTQRRAPAHDAQLPADGQPDHELLGLAVRPDDGGADDVEGVAVLDLHPLPYSPAVPVAGTLTTTPSIPAVCSCSNQPIASS
jgi:hypothetical protein